MKVLCINGVKLGEIIKGTLMDTVACKSDQVFEGVVYTVTGTGMLFGEEGYYLEGKWHLDLYRKSRFIPLSKVDETELLEQREDCLVKL